MRRPRMTQDGLNVPTRGGTPDGAATAGDGHATDPDADAKPAAAPKKQAAKRTGRRRRR